MTDLIRQRITSHDLESIRRTSVLLRGKLVEGVVARRILFQVAILYQIPYEISGLQEVAVEVVRHRNAAWPWMGIGVGWDV